MLTVKENRLVWIGGFETRNIPKAAGMRWDPANKEWWTTDESRAIALLNYADENAKIRLQKTEIAIAASEAADSEAEIPVPEGLSYLPYQRAGIAYAMHRPGTLIGDEMGLGKTIQALGLANAIGIEAFPMLIVCPASLRLNWQREAKKWLMQEKLSYCIVDGGAPDPAARIAQIVIINYDIIPKHIDALTAREWGMLVCDEAHYLKSAKTNRSKAVLGYYDKASKSKVPGLVDKAKRKVFLTGTPISNRPAEIQPLAGALAPAKFGNFFAFAKRYCGGNQTGFGWDFSGASNLDELQRRLRATIMVRRCKADVLKELPAKRRQIIELSPNGSFASVRRESEAWDAQRDAVECAQADVDAAHASGDEESYKAAVAKMQGVFGAAFSEMAIIRRELAEAKAPKVVEHIKAMLEDGDVEKVVIFAHHKSVVKILCEGLREFGVVSVTGETAMEDRQSAVDGFQGRAAVRVFVGNIKAAGVGLTLTASSTVIFAELDWTPANMSQAEDRCHRIGQKESVLVQHLVFDGSLDSIIAKRLIAKQAVIDAAMDDEMTFREPIAPSLAPEKKADKRPKEYPSASQQEIDDCLSLLRYMSALDSDRASAINGIGWSKIDGKIGHDLSGRLSLTNGQVWLSRKILRKYGRQIGMMENFLRLFPVAKDPDNLPF